MVGSESPSKISAKGLWKVFGKNADRALEVGADWSNEEFIEKTGCVVAVRNVSFEVRPSETFVVMGLSGSGKSTLIRCISRLIEPTQGQVILDGTDLITLDGRRLRELRRNKMSMVFQHFGLLPHRRVLENVVLGLEAQGVKKEARNQRAFEVLKLVGLAGWETRYPRELSGGMQQRVGLARALAVDPEILLFDEPFSALDPLIRRDMQDELINLQKMFQKTIVFITHDFLEALKIGDRIAIMKDGVFVQIGTPEEIITNPVDDYVKDFTRDVPRAKVLTAGTLMTPPELTVQDTSDPCEILSRMSSSGTVWALVVSSSGHFGGIVHQQDASRGVASGMPDLKDVALTNTTAATADTLLEDLIPLAIENESPIPIVDERHTIQGVISRKSIVSGLAADG